VGWFDRGHAVDLRWPMGAVGCWHVDTMRTLQHTTFQDSIIQRALDIFYGQMAELGIQESDVVSVSVMSAAEQPTPQGVTMDMTPMGSNYEIVVVYWSADEPRLPQIADGEPSPPRPNGN
jgi:hypothetical protein